MIVSIKCLLVERSSGFLKAMLFGLLTRFWSKVLLVHQEVDKLDHIFLWVFSALSFSNINSLISFIDFLFSSSVVIYYKLLRVTCYIAKRVITRYFVRQFFLTAQFIFWSLSRKLFIFSWLVRLLFIDYTFKSLIRSSNRMGIKH